MGNDTIVTTVADLAAGEILVMKSDYGIIMDGEGEAEATRRTQALSAASDRSERLEIYIEPLVMTWDDFVYGTIDIMADLASYTATYLSIAGTIANLRCVAIGGAAGGVLSSLMFGMNTQHNMKLRARTHGDCDPKPKDDPRLMDTNGGQDPSGYVYEAVPSNRLQGVTATIYKQGDNKRWDAESFGQINPQTTDKNGMYQWDVPAGNWIVKFAMNGYESADTSGVPQAIDGWLPVPPPQLNINVGMVAVAGPSVARAAAYTDQALVVFSQYMDIGSVQAAAAVTVDGVPVKVNAIPLDAEYDLEGEHQYATRAEVAAVLMRFCLYREGLE